MCMKRTWRKIIGLLGIAVIVFAQFALSAHACPVPGASTDLDKASMTTPGETPDGTPPALCQKHCQDEEQQPTDSSPGTPAIFSLPAFSIRIAVDHSRLPEAALVSPRLLHASFPSLAIRNCCFRV